MYNHEVQWPRVKELAENSGSTEQITADIAAFVRSLPDTREQIALFRFAIRSLMFQEWKNKTLEPLIQLADLTIETALKIGETDQANITCFNMSANLAGCWDDGFQRDAGNFRKGLQYAERALEFRRQLKKGPGPFALAFWARGIHQFFLKDFVSAEESFRQSLKSAVEAAQAAGVPTTMTTEAPFAVLVAKGYIALAELAQGRKAALATYNAVIDTFEKMRALSEEAKEDADIGLKQLRTCYSQDFYQ